MSQTEALQDNPGDTFAPSAPSTSEGLPNEDACAAPPKFYLLKRFVIQSSSNGLTEEAQNHFNESKRMRLQTDQNSSNGSDDLENEDGDSSFSTCDDANDDDEGDDNADSGSHRGTDVIDEEPLPLQNLQDDSPARQSSSSSDGGDSGRGSVPPADNENGGSVDGLLRLRNGTFSVRHLEGHSDIVFSVAGENDCIISTSRDTTLKVWNCAGEETANLGGHTGSVNCVILLSRESSSALSASLSCSDAGLLVASGSEDSSVRIWSLFKASLLKSLYIFTSVMSLGFIESTLYLVIGTGSGKLEIWDVVEGICKHSLKISEEPVKCIKVDSNYVCAGSLDQLSIYEAIGGRLEARWNIRDARQQIAEHVTCLTSCAFEFRGEKIYTASFNDILVIDWKSDEDGRSIAKVNNSPVHTAITSAIAIKEDVLIASSFEPKTKKSYINVFQLPGVNYVGSLCFADLNQILAVTITKNEEGILQVASGGLELLLWDVVPSQTLENDSAEDMYRVNYIPELETERFDSRDERSELSRPAASERQRHSGWRCSIS